MNNKSKQKKPGHNARFFFRKKFDKCLDVWKVCVSLSHQTNKHTEQMIFSTNIEVTVEVYRKQYTITFKTPKGMQKWMDEAKHPESYGGKREFIRLSTTRDANYFHIESIVKH